MEGRMMNGLSMYSGKRKGQPSLLQVGNITAKLLRSNRKTLSIEIKEEGITVRAPRWANNAEIKDFLLRKEDWIRKHQEKVRTRRKRMDELPPFTDRELQELTERAKKYIPSRVEYYADIIGVDYGRITIRHQRTRWGSCSGKGNLNFNCLLMLFPEDVIDSVVVHELCHRIHMDHSSALYRDVERVFPKYRECHRWLREKGSLQLGRLR